MQDIYDIAIENGWHFALWAWRGDPEFGGNVYEVFDSLSVLSNQPIQSHYWNTVLNMFKTEPTGIYNDKNPNAQNPKHFELHQNYPNPFNPETSIIYQLPTAGNVELSVYNVLGQKVRTLVSMKQPAGFYKTVWDGENESGLQASSGVYVFRLRFGDNVKHKKMLLLR